MTNKLIRLIVKDTINRETAVSSDDGDILYVKIKSHLNEGDFIELDFLGITLLTTAFLNSAIGQLYNDFKSDELNNLLKLVNIAPEDRILFKKVISRAKEYFANKKGFEDSANNGMYGS